MSLYFFVKAMKKRLLNIYFRLLGSLARWYIRKRKPYVVGVNGSVGKTSCRMIIHQTLSTLLPKLHIETSPKNFNGELGMSLSIFAIKAYTPTIFGMINALLQCMMKSFFSSVKPYDVIILEYWIDHPWEMSFLIDIVQPHCSIHTQIDAVHSEQFGNPDKIAREEFLLQQHTRNIVFINTDDPYLHHVMNKITVDTITYSASHTSHDTTIDITPLQRNAALWAVWSTNSNNIVQSNTITYNNAKNINLNINLLWDYHIAYAAIGVCLADILSRHFFQKDAVSEWQDISLELQLQPGRWTLFGWIHKSIIVDSTYNSSPRSVAHIIESTTERRDSNYPNHKLLFVLGDMRELGTQEIKAHEALAQLLQQQNASVFLVWQNMKAITMPYLKQHGTWDIEVLKWFEHYEAVGQYLQWYLLQHNTTPYIVVFKWSQNTIFLEEAVKYILLDPSDYIHLTRQWDRWEHKKELFIKSCEAKNSGSGIK